MADRPDPPDANPMRGRAAEYDAVLSLLKSTEEGQGKILLVEGAPGMGKSQLLAVARREARERGLSLVAAAADELSQPTPLAPLQLAVHAATAQLRRGSRRPGSAAARAPAADIVLSGLQKLASAGPVLVTVDDVHWADQATAQAFRSIPRLLASYPLSWILAMAKSPQGSTAELLFDLLERDGATRITLGPLDHEAQVALISDVLRAIPDTKLIDLAADAAGNPCILAEAFGGLLEENAIAVCDGYASLAATQVPARIKTLARDKLKGLSPRTRQFTETAAILGRSFRFEDVAEMLGESPGALLAALDEAVSAHLLAATPDGLTFQHEFIRQAIAHMLPEPVQQALHWQFGQLLLARGGSAVPAASHLLSGARPGDAVALAGLDRAVREVLPFAPRAAADLATGVLVLTLPSDPGRSARLVTAAKALTAAGQWDAAESLVRSALAVPLPALDGAALRCTLSSLLSLTGRATEAMAEAQAVLANFDVTPDLRDDATIALLSGWLGLRGNEQVAQLAGAILAEPSARRGDVVVTAMIALAIVMWDTGKPTEALDLAAQAVRKVAAEPCGTTPFSPHLFLAARLIDMGRAGEATAIIDSVEPVVPVEASAANPWPEGIAQVLRARVALAAGRLDDAAALAESALRPPDAPASRGHDALALPILATIALRRGDLRAAAEYAQLSRARGDDAGSGYLTSGPHLVAAQVLEARRGPQAALDSLADVLADLPEHRSVLLSDPADAAWLVGVALAAGDRGQAERVSAIVAEMSRNNPTFPAIRASAEYAAGLLTSDASRLQHAAEQLPDPWFRSCAAEDQGVLLAAAGRQDEAAHALDQALREYIRLGAARDVARTRRRLRQIGVRRRHWAAERRPAAGWESLTETERATARLVAQGLTNQQAANQLFISAHTVAFHLRKVFRKLGVHSRVELARIELEHTYPEQENLS